MPDGSRSTRFNQAPNHERLIDVAHAHFVFKEIDEIFKFHAVMSYKMRALDKLKILDYVRNYTVQSKLYTLYYFCLSNITATSINSDSGSFDLSKKVNVIIVFFLLEFRA